MSDDLYTAFSGAFRCTTATSLHYMERDLGSGGDWYSLALPIAVNIINLESDLFIRGQVNIDVVSIDGSVPRIRLAELATLTGNVWRLGKTVAVVTPSHLRITLMSADTEDIGKHITAFVVPIEPS